MRELRGDVRKSVSRKVVNESFMFYTAALIIISTRLIKTTRECSKALVASDAASLLFVLVSAESYSTLGMTYQKTHKRGMT